jgi:hypothetical protein
MSATKRKRIFYTKEYDQQRAALKRAKKYGFASVAEHRKSIEAKAAQRPAALEAKRKQVESDKAKAAAERAAAKPPGPAPETLFGVQIPQQNQRGDYVATVMRDGVIRRDPLPPVASTPPPALPTPKSAEPKQATPAPKPASDLPPPGLGMCYWTMAQLEAHKRMLREKNTPRDRYSVSDSPCWEALAAEARAADHMRRDNEDRYF